MSKKSLHPAAILACYAGQVLDVSPPQSVAAHKGVEFARIYTIHPNKIDEVDFYQQNLYGNQTGKASIVTKRTM